MAIDFSDVYGSQGGGQGLQDIMNNLLETLYEGQYFGTEADFGAGSTGTPGTNLPSYIDTTAADYESYDPFNIWGDTTPNIPEGLDPMSSASSMQQYLDWYSQWGLAGSSTGDESVYGGLTPGMTSLQDLFTELDLPGLTQGYAQDIGDVQTEMGGRIKGLQSAYSGRKGKGTRYGGIGLGSRPAGRRDDYLSDYYGITDEWSQMQEGLQQGVVTDYNDEIFNFLASTTAGGYGS